MGPAVKPYTEIPHLEAIVLEESYVLDIHASPGLVSFQVEFALTPAHPAYVAPRPGDVERFCVGRLRFLRVRRLVWDLQGAKPATDASGETDFGHIDFLNWDGTDYRLGGDWGEMDISAGGVTVDLE
jgi:hypothetical protein